MIKIQKIFLVIVLFICTLIISPISVKAIGDGLSVEATVTRIIEEKEIEVMESNQLYQKLELELSTIDHKKVIIENGNQPMANIVKYVVNDRVLVNVTTGLGGEEYVITDFVRKDSLVLLSIIFVILLVVIARWKGLSSLLGMIFTFFVVFTFVLPRLLAGNNPVLIAVGASLVIIPVSFYLAHEFNKKTTIAIISSIISLIITAILATNITAIAFISKDIKSSRQTLLNGLFYTLGRGISYTLLATLIYFGLSSFSISSIFQGWGDKILGPVLILIGLIMADIIKINLKNNNPKIEEIKLWLAKKGYIGSLLLGMLFALAFCPYSGVLFFGVLTPMVLKSSESLLLPPLFALGTGLPVIIFSFILAFSAKKIGVFFNKIQKLEVIIRKIISLIFISVGMYYCQFLIKFILGIV